MSQPISNQKLPNTPWGLLPPRLRVLFVTGPKRTGRWLADALAADSAAEVVLEEALGISAGAARLRDEVFDVVLISHEPGYLNSLEVIDALRAGSNDEQPILVLGELPEKEMTSVCFEAGADAYICLSTTTTRALIWQLARARERHALISENRLLTLDQRHRLQMEHDETARLLQQQRALISDLEKIREEAGEDDPAAKTQSPLQSLAGDISDLPKSLVQHYRELLRTYVIMGSGNLTEEMHRLADMVTAADLTGQQVMRVHLKTLEEVVQGLGSRSARHVMNRADLLILEVMLNLAEGYRERGLPNQERCRKAS